MAVNINSCVRSLKKKFNTVSTVADSETFGEVVSTGNKAFDLILDGGIPFGAMAEFAGFNSSGKSLFLQNILANAQRDYDAIGIVADRENAFTDKRAKEIGIDTNNVIVAKPADIPQAVDAFTFIEESILLVRKQDPLQKIVIIIDSISAFDKDVELAKAETGRKAKQIHEGLRRFFIYINVNTMLLVANQKTFKVGVNYGINTTVTGGEGTKYYSSVRLTLGEGRKILEPTKGNEVVGMWIPIHVDKSRMGSCHRNALIPFYYKEGIPYYGGYARLLADRGYIQPNNKTEWKSGKQHTFSYGELKRANENNMEEFLEKHPELLFDEYPEWGGGTVSDEEPEENEGE